MFKIKTMKKVILTFVLALCTAVSYSQKKGCLNTNKPDRIVVYNKDYSLAITLQYVLTTNNIKIIHKRELVGEKDSILFQVKLDTNIISTKFSQISIDSLKERYDNWCVQDGSQITVVLSKGKKSKSVHLGNYYQPSIDTIIKLVNHTVPQEYKIWYDRDILLKRMERCK